MNSKIIISFHLISFCRSIEGQLWRDIREDLTPIYPKDEVKTWRSLSSRTKSLDVLQQSQFVDDTGIRTLFCIEDVLNGKNISHHSYFKREEEILLLSGSTFLARQTSNNVHETAWHFSLPIIYQHGAQVQICSHD